MTRTHINYIRTYRKKSGLTQQELASLLGLRSGQIVSRYEQHSRAPNLNTILAFQIIFGVTTDELFPGIYAQVELKILKRIRKLLDNLAVEVPTPVIVHKRQILEQIIKKAEMHLTYPI
jgi:transcriptional regulator with XRE-family HTH domain